MEDGGWLLVTSISEWCFNVTKNMRGDTIYITDRPAVSQKFIHGKVGSIDLIYLSKLGNSAYQLYTMKN